MENIYRYEIIVNEKETERIYGTVAANSPDEALTKVMTKYEELNAVNYEIDATPLDNSGGIIEVLHIS